MSTEAQEAIRLHCQPFIKDITKIAAWPYNTKPTKNTKLIPKMTKKPASTKMTKTTMI